MAAERFDSASGTAAMSAGSVVGPSPPQSVTVARLGALRWAELVVFAVAGSWVPSTPEPAARIALAGVSRHAARRAGVLGDRLPTAGPLHAGAVTVPASPALLGVAADLDEVVGTVERLAVLGGVVLPGIGEALEELLGSLSPVADATSLRTLPPLLDDLRSDAAALDRCAGEPGLGAAGVGGDVRGDAAAGIAARVAAAGGW